MYIENTIIIEGLDGAGTTTQARLIGEKFQKEGREVFLTHEPTDNPIGKVVRQVLQKKISTTPEALALLFSSDRDDHLYNEEYGISDRSRKTESSFPTDTSILPSPTRECSVIWAL